MQGCSVAVAAGIDPTGSAGLTHIVSTVRAMGCYAAGVPASLVVEDLRGVKRVEPIDSRLFSELLRLMLDTLNPRVVVLSSMPSSEHVKAASDLLGSKLVIADPVWMASAGGRLVIEEWRLVVDALLSTADIVALNLIELSALTGVETKSLRSIVGASKSLIRRYGVEAVIVRGGHGLDCRDVLVEHDGYMVVGDAPGCIQAKVHGSGCTHLAILAACIAHGMNIDEATYIAWRLTRRVIEASSDGISHTEVLAGYWVREVLEDVEAALELLTSEWRLVYRLIPEVGTNIVSMSPTGLWAGVDGRIRRGVKGPVAGMPRLYASSHLARALGTIRKFAPWVRGAVNIVFNEGFVKRASELGYVVSSYDRRAEPPHIKSVEGATIPWGVETSLKRVEPLVPDVIYHTGDWGKEPIAIVFGRSARDAVRKLLEIASEA